MAEAVTNHLAAMWKNSLPAVLRESVTLPWAASSAGLYPAAGDPIAQNAVLALEEAGIEGVEGADYHLHTARSLQDVSAEDMDLLVAMTPSHAMELMMRYPHMAQKITLMPTPVSDPFGGDLARYRACLAEITDGVKTLLFESEGEA
jgi:protein-tyrosine phosphatase